MLSAMQKVPGYYHHEISGWEAPDSLSTEAYRDMLLNSIFALCPKGWWNLDSFRIYEALECGAIPIVEKEPLDYFSEFYGPHPFLTVANWEEAPALVKNLIDHPEELEQKQKDCYKWWTAYKTKLKHEVADVIKKAFIP